MSGARPTAAEAVADRLVTHVADLQAADDARRAGDPEGIHDARVCCRRLRSDLWTYRPLLDRALTDPLRPELAWVARVLGQPRDAQVVHARLGGLVEREQVALVVGPVRERLEESRTAALRAAEEDAAAALGSGRYLALVSGLRRLASGPPWAARPPEDPLAAVRARVHRRGRDLLRLADAVAAAEERDTALHEARKAARRWRYAAEGTLPLWGEEVRRVATAARRLTVLLGEHHDTVVCRGVLLRLAADARAAGESDFTFGRLHAREQARATEIDREFEELWRGMRRRSRLRGWLE